MIRLQDLRAGRVDKAYIPKPLGNFWGNIKAFLENEKVLAGPKGELLESQLAG